MYEDYQVMKPVGEGNLVTNSGNIFGLASWSPTTTIQNPNYKLTSMDKDNFNSSYIIPKEENEMMSMNESGSGYNPVEDNAIEQQSPPAKKKRFHRHTARQIQEMEAFFEENPHPDEEQRTRLSEELGLKPRQIKFWFQNKRTQIKAQQDRRDNAMLKAENFTLKMENHNLHSHLKGVSCSSCDGSGDKIRLENSRLRLENSRLHRELDLLRSIASLSQETAAFFSETNENKVILIAEDEKASAMDLAVSCVQELAKMCNTSEPLWNKKRSLDNNNESVTLNKEEYKKMLQWPPLDNNDHIRREVSRANAVVLMNSITIVNTFLDAEKWSEMFCPIVARAKTIQIISSGASGPSGSLLLMHAELQGLSPLVPTREAYFLRYTQQNKDEGKWLLVDFPIDSLIKPVSVSATCTDQYRRNPSGCVIEDMPNGYSKVTWVEHVEVEEKRMLHESVREYVKSGVAFGAQRWLAVLQRQCERMATLIATNITDLGVIPSVEARRNLMRLSQTMVRDFCLNINGQALSESTEDTIRITTMKVCGHDVICAVSTTPLPYSHQQVFDLLRDELHRSQILFNGKSLEEIAYIANGSNPGNCISLLRINVATYSKNSVELLLQETCIDSSGSLVVYSTIDAEAVRLVLNGKDPSSIPLLPIGFSVVPVNPSEGISVSSPSCLLTVGIQVLASNVATAKPNHSILTNVKNSIRSTVNQITFALGSSRTSAAGGSVILKQEVSC